MSEEEYDELLSKEDTFRLTLRHCIQVSIKNLSLLIGDRVYDESDEEVLNLQHFGVLPYPDFNLTSLTFFRFIKPKFSTKPIASSFSILVDENKRSFLYNNVNQIKPLVLTPTVT